MDTRVSHPSKWWLLKLLLTTAKNMSSSGKIKAPFGTNRSDLRYYLYLLLCTFLIAYNVEYKN